MKMRKVMGVVAGLGITLSAVAQLPQQGPPQQQQQQQQKKIDVSDEQLESFVEVSTELQELQKGVQEEIQGMAEEKGLEQATFQEMANKQMQGTQVESMEGYSEEQKSAFSETMEVAQKKQMGMMQDVQKMVKDAGMDMQTFQQIATQLRSDQELQKRYQSLVGGQQGASPSQSRGGGM